MSLWPFTLVCAVAGDPASRHAASVSIDLAERTGSSVHFVHAVTHPAATLAGRDVLAAAAAEAAAHDADRVVALRPGKPADAIIGYAREVDPDLIVTGTRHRSGLGQILTGSVAQRMLDADAYPLLIVPEAAAWPPQQVIVADDGSASASRTAGLAAAIAEAYDAPVTLLRALSSGDLRDEREAVTAFTSARDELWAQAHQLGEGRRRQPQVQVRARPITDVVIDAAEQVPATLMAVGRNPLDWRHDVSETLLTYQRAVLLVAPSDGSRR